MATCLDGGHLPGQGARRRRVPPLNTPAPALPPSTPLPPSPLPQNFRVYGYARSKMSDEEFRDMIGSSLTCRIADS